MARGGNSLTAGISGHIGKQFVIKQYKNRTVITKFPDMSNIKPSKDQKKKRSRFAEAVAHAQKILRDPKLRAEHEKEYRKRGRTLYHHLMKKFLANDKK